MQGREYYFCQKHRNIRAPNGYGLVSYTRIRLTELFAPATAARCPDLESLQTDDRIKHESRAHRDLIDLNPAVEVWRTLLIS